MLGGKVSVFTLVFMLSRTNSFLIRKSIFNDDNIFGNSTDELNTEDYKSRSRDDCGKPVDSRPIPEYYDWRDLGVVSAVKNQDSCAACSAFSVVANIESHLAIYRNQYETLSEQFIIDCDTSIDSCDGNTSILGSFGKIVNKFGGVLRQSDYYLYANRRWDCRWNFKNPYPVPVIGYRRVLGHEKNITEALFKYGPLSAAINSASMEKYQNRNTIDEPTELQCPSNAKNHAVLIVGYNVAVEPETGRRIPYWIIKNSWGEEWGDRGYYYIVRGRNACGIESDVSFALV